MSLEYTSIELATCKRVMPLSLASNSLAVLCRGVDWQEAESLQEVAADVEVLYQTRIQKERFQDRPEDYEKARGKYIINADLMKILPKQSVVMHPLPRVDEVMAACCSSRSLICLYLSCSIRLLNTDCLAFVVNCDLLCVMHLPFDIMHRFWQLCCPMLLLFLLHKPQMP
jgi:hypothetical protein